MLLQATRGLDVPAQSVSHAGQPKRSVYHRGVFPAHLMDKLAAPLGTAKRKPPRAGPSGPFRLSCRTGGTMAEFEHNMLERSDALHVFQVRADPHPRPRTNLR